MPGCRPFSMAMTFSVSVADVRRSTGDDVFERPGIGPASANLRLVNQFHSRCHICDHPPEALSEISKKPDKPTEATRAPAPGGLVAEVLRQVLMKIDAGVLVVTKGEVCVSLGRY